MIGNKGYEGKNFKDSLRYEMPKITMADLADEFLENLKAREKKKIEKISGKNPENKKYLLCGAGKISVNKSREEKRAKFKIFIVLKGE